MKAVNTALFLCSISAPLSVVLPFENAITINVPKQTTNDENKYNQYFNQSDTKQILLDDYYLNLITDEQISLITKKIAYLIKHTIVENDETELVEFIKNSKDNKLFLKSVSLLFSDNTKEIEQSYFINILLASDIDIFDDWYKLALIIASNSSSHSLARRAKDILNYYLEDFKTIDLSNVFN